jgi:hypothetical protein
VGFQRKTAGGDPITADYPHFMTRSLRRSLRSAN